MIEDMRYDVSKRVILDGDVWVAFWTDAHTWADPFGGQFSDSDIQMFDRIRKSAVQS